MTVSVTSSKTNSSDDVVTGIKELIIREGLSPGDRLPPEIELAERFGVSRHKLREEIAGLTAMGILEATPRRGTTVREYDPSLWAANLSFHGQISGYELADAQEARIAMELSVVPAVVRNATTEDWLNFETLLAKMDIALEEGDLALFVKADQEFHEGLVDATHNPLLRMLRPMISWMFEELLNSHSGTVETHRVEYLAHCAIVKALRARNIVEAQALLEAHLRQGLKSIKEKVDKSK